MTAQIKLGLGLFILLTSLIITVFALSHFMSDDSLYQDTFPFKPLVFLGSIYIIGIYLIYISIIELTEVDEENEEYDDDEIRINKSDEELIDDGVDGGGHDIDYDDSTMTDSSDDDFDREGRANDAEKSLYAYDNEGFDANYVRRRN